MCKIVIDTNVFISSRISSAGNPAKIMKLITDDKIDLYYSSNILNEYKRVLSYTKFNFTVEVQKASVEDIKNIGNLIKPIKSDIFMPDESDRIFYDTANAAEAYLITGNIKHYPEESHIITPTQFIEMFEI